MSLLISLLSPRGGSEIEQIIAEELAAGRNVIVKGTEAIQKVVRRALARTGSDTNRLLRSAFTKKNPFALEPLYRHPITDVVVSRQAKRFPSTTRMYRPGSSNDVTGDFAVGGAFYKAMNYHLVFEGSGKQEVYIGAQSPQGSDIFENPAYKPKKKPLILSSQWQERFKNWQEAGNLWTGMSTKAYLAAINAPIGGMQVRRPERPVLSLVEKRIDPADVFRKALRERLSR